MKNFKSLFLVTGLLLTGCQTAGQLGSNRDETNQIDVTSTYPYELQTKLVDPVPEPKQTTTAVIEPEIAQPTKNKVASIPAAATEVPATTPPPAIEIKPQARELSSWQPNEGHLIRGNELISGLQREIGRKPTTAEMRARLKSHMGLSAAQAEKLAEELSS